jgi:branched-chain amino acid transport system substrate-binding protein
MKGRMGYVIGGMFLFAICIAFLYEPGMTGAQEKRGKIQYAYLGPMSGAAAAYGEEQFAGVQLAVADINSAGGIKVGGKSYDIEAHAFDVEETPEKSVMKMNEAVSLYHPMAIQTAHSMASMPLKEFAKEKGFILLGISEIPGFTEPRNPLAVRIWLKVADQGPMLDHLRRLGINKLAILAHSGEVSVKWAEVSRTMWKEKGGTVVGEVTYPVDSTDFSSPVTKLLSSNPEAIASGGNPDVRAANILKIARELGFKGKFFFGGSCRGPRMINLIGKELAEGTTLVGTSVEKGSPKIDAFKQRMSKLYPGKPYGLVYMVGYESLFLLKAAVEKSGSVTDLYKIAGAFETAITPQTSPLGLWLTVKNGEAQFDLHTVEIRNGQVIPVN